MNQISLYNKSTDSKLTIEAEELTRSRNIKIPKDGSFLLTNKTRLTEDLADKYTVGPTGDFQELEEAVRVLCNMKQYAEWKRLSKKVTLELQPNYIFKSYCQSSLDASFIYIKSNTPVTINVTDGANIDPYAMSIFAITNGGKSPKFKNITFNITATDTRLLWSDVQSYLSLEGCTFNINYRDNVRIVNQTFARVELSGVLRLSNVVFNIEVNKNNDLLLNSGKPYTRHYFSVIAYSNISILATKFNIKDYSNQNDNSLIRVLNISERSTGIMDHTSVINCECDHGKFELISSHHHGALTAASGVTITANSKTNNEDSIIWSAYEQGFINCEHTVLLNCGTQNKPIRSAFNVYKDGRLLIRSYKKTNSFFTNDTNIPVNTLNRDGVISS